VENAGVEKAGVDRTGGNCRSGKYWSENVWKTVRTENKNSHQLIITDSKSYKVAPVKYSPLAVQILTS